MLSQGYGGELDSVRDPQRLVFTGVAAVCADSQNALPKMSTECSEGTEKEAVASVVALVRIRIPGTSAEKATPEPEFHSTIQVTNIWCAPTMCQALCSGRQYHRDDRQGSCFQGASSVASEIVNK